MRTWPAAMRGAMALCLALLLCVRLLSPAGFMPSFDHGGLTIVACPDGALAQPVHDHHGPKTKLHQACPYAAASALGGLANEPAALAALLVIGLALLLGRPFAFLAGRRAFDRPHSRGPPIPA